MVEQLDYLNYINGQWVGDSYKKIKVFNPATGEYIGSVPDADEEHAKQAIEAASQALPKWSKKSAADRSDVLRKYYDLIMTHENEIAEIMTKENGKPLKESKGEVQYAASFIEWYAEEGKRIYGRMIPGKRENHRIKVIKQPVGIVAAITPWNFPAAMITRKLGPALAAGCTFIVKPPEETPLTCMRLVELAEEAGIPRGVFNVVNGNPEKFSETVMSDMRVRKLTFTGSTPVGKLLMKQGAEQVMKLSLELGGHAPVIVCDDANLDQTVEMLMAAKFRNSGQTCIAANRVYAQSSIYDELVRRMTEEVKKLNVGNGLENGIDVGPLINKEGLEKVGRHARSTYRNGMPSNDRRRVVDTVSLCSNIVCGNPI
ncbi:hypothetical protein BKP56_03310 [Marinilactibacillus sp. 15R]|uniref:Succinate-semialdehyde dehydrogenase / glutarate-semialdehyde dehydrogenase n=1 Tax=Marinilactibacillus piezotolerans TaxID=258723 RepID=A0A1I4BF76_9LACT|nr:MULTISPECIES: NAD-dependent succinate-semialdehyde dehydrogenase [Marinilactibacillus]API88384.1 hypothetical protein BKP56_03310 [Marinilactibacillus sp. 15R]SFK66940.1 succinate-semialdehyde dehydrogenase / glutarate-semialdehyde dehydrogenase [Marinilactibacillus piezotolerans]